MDAILRAVQWPATRVGTHLLCEWHGCDFSAPQLNLASSLRALCLRAAQASGLDVEDDVFQQFEPRGVTGTVLLAESHLAIHTWPDEGFVTLDVYVCNDKQDHSQKAIDVYSALKAYFRPLQVSVLRAPGWLQAELQS